MKDGYRLRKHKNLVVIAIEEYYVRIVTVSTITKNFQEFNSRKIRKHVYNIQMYEQHILTNIKYRKDSFITYDKQKTNILSWGDSQFKSDNEDVVQIFRFSDILNGLSQKSKYNWDQYDMFSLKAISDFIKLLVEEEMNSLNMQTGDTSTFHYMFIAPSEWEEETREAVIRPIFVQASLISKDDHKDRLLFCSDLKATFYSIADSSNNQFSSKKEKNMIVFRIADYRNWVVIRLDEILATNLSSIKPIRSGSVCFALDIFIWMKDFLKSGLLFDIKDKILYEIAYKLYEDFLLYTNILYEENYNNEELYKSSLFSLPSSYFREDWGLNEYQKDFINSITRFDLYSGLEKITLNNLKRLLAKNLAKEYDISTFIYGPCRGNIDSLQLLLLKYIKISTSPKNIVYNKNPPNYMDPNDMLKGAARFAFEAIKNSDMCGITPYVKPELQDLLNLL